MKKILFVDNTAHHLYGQLHNISAMQKAKYEVSLLIPDDGVYFCKLQNMGFKCYNDITTWKGQNPFQELALLLKLKKLIRRIKPDLICSFTIKPNLYTAIIAKSLPIKQVANITGLGYGFMSGNIKEKAFTFLYRYAFRLVEYIFFQNKDDYNYFNNSKIASDSNRLKILPGSGVDLTNYTYVGVTDRANINFLYSGRLIADKGINELVSAFLNVRKKYPTITLTFIGNYFPDNPSAITEKQIDLWVEQGLINYLGMVDNVQELIANADCVVLPSYREGMPRSLLEASAMGKPIITVDSVGCRDVVEDGITGFMAKVKDVDSLAQAMIKFIELPLDKKIEMGLNGRRKMEREFDQKIVVNEYLTVVNKLLNN